MNRKYKWADISQFWNWDRACTFTQNYQVFVTSKNVRFWKGPNCQKLSRSQNTWNMKFKRLIPRLNSGIFKSDFQGMNINFGIPRISMIYAIIFIFLNKKIAHWKKFCWFLILEFNLIIPDTLSSMTISDF